MFDDKYGLTEAVLEGRKTITRRVIPAKAIEYILGEFKQEYFEGTLDVFDSDKKYIEQYYLVEKCGKCFGPGDIVAVAQNYKNAGFTPDAYIGKDLFFDETPGWTNKMFVRADLMPHKICITNVRVERLQGIGYEDCMKEGIYKDNCPTYFNGFAEQIVNDDRNNILAYRWHKTPREAFSALIDKISGKGTWEKNPWVFVYEFELVK